MTATRKIAMGAQNWLYPLPALLIGAMVEGKPNFMTAAWGSIANAEPPMLSVAIRRSRYTRKGIEEDGSFSVNVASASQASEVDFCGIESGAKVDKAAKCGFTIFYGLPARAPMIVECPLNLECMVKQIVELPTHSLVIADISETHVSESCILDGKIDVDMMDPIVYITSPIRKYGRLGTTVADAFSAGLNL